MKHINNYSSFIPENTLNEIFGGKSSDILLPKLDKILDTLNDIRIDVTKEISNKDTRKIEVIYDYLLNDMDLTILAKMKRESDELTGNKTKEKFTDKIKRSIDNF